MRREQKRKPPVLGTDIVGQAVPCSAGANGIHFVQVKYNSSLDQLISLTCDCPAGLKGQAIADAAERLGGQSCRLFLNSVREAYAYESGDPQGSRLGYLLDRLRRSRYRAHNARIHPGAPHAALEPETLLNALMAKRLRALQDVPVPLVFATRRRLVISGRLIAVYNLDMARWEAVDHGVAPPEDVVRSNGYCSVCYCSRKDVKSHKGTPKHWNAWRLYVDTLVAYLNARARHAQIHGVTG